MNDARASVARAGIVPDGSYNDDRFWHSPITCAGPKSEAPMEGLVRFSRNTAGQENLVVVW